MAQVHCWEFHDLPHATDSSRTRAAPGTRETVTTIK